MILRKRCRMSQMPSNHQPEEKQEGGQHIPPRHKQPMLLLEGYTRSTLKTKISLWSVFTLVLLLLALGVSLLTVKWPFSVPFRNAGVNIAAIPVYYVSPPPAGNDANNGSVTHPFATIQKAANAAKAAATGATIH